MKDNVFVKTGNVKAFFTLAEKLRRVEAGVPGMGLIHGFKGLGKTTVAIHYAAQKCHQAVYARAHPDWTASWMLEKILVELGVAPRRGQMAKFDDMVSSLLENPRLVIIDEANLIKASLLETLRAAHDLTHNPFLFVGHEGILKDLMRSGPFYDRILYQTELKPLGLSDLETFCAEALEVGIDGEALERVLQEAGGNFRKSVICLKALEDKAKVKGADKIDAGLVKGLR